jgi:precorrin-6B methylase 2
MVGSVQTGAYPRATTAEGFAIPVKIAMPGDTGDSGIVRPPTTRDYDGEQLFELKPYNNGRSHEKWLWGSFKIREVELGSSTTSNPSSTRYEISEVWIRSAPPYGKEQSIRLDLPLTTTNGRQISNLKDARARASEIINANLKGIEAQLGGAARAFEVMPTAWNASANSRQENFARLVFQSLPNEGLDEVKEALNALSLGQSVAFSAIVGKMLLSKNPLVRAMGEIINVLDNADDANGIAGSILAMRDSYKKAMETNDPTAFQVQARKFSMAIGEVLGFAGNAAGTKGIRLLIGGRWIGPGGKLLNDIVTTSPRATSPRTQTGNPQRRAAPTGQLVQVGELDGSSPRGAAMRSALLSATGDTKLVSWAQTAKVGQVFSYGDGGRVTVVGLTKSGVHLEFRLSPQFGNNTYFVVEYFRKGKEKGRLDLPQPLKPPVQTLAPGKTEVSGGASGLNPGLNIKQKDLTSAAGLRDPASQRIVAGLNAYANGDPLPAGMEGSFTRSSTAFDMLDTATGKWASVTRNPTTGKISWGKAEGSSGASGLNPGLNIKQKDLTSAAGLRDPASQRIVAGLNAYANGDPLPAGMEGSFTRSSTAFDMLDTATGKWASVTRNPGTGKIAWGGTSAGSNTSLDPSRNIKQKDLTSAAGLRDPASQRIVAGLNAYANGEPLPAGMEGSFTRSSTAFDMLDTATGKWASVTRNPTTGKIAWSATGSGSEVAAGSNPNELAPPPATNDSVREGTYALLNARADTKNLTEEQKRLLAESIFERAAKVPANVNSDAGYFNYLKKLVASPGWQDLINKVKGQSASSNLTTPEGSGAGNSNQNTSGIPDSSGVVVRGGFGNGSGSTNTGRASRPNEPVARGTFEAINPKTGDISAAWDVTIWRVGNIPQAKLELIAESLRRVNPETYAKPGTTVQDTIKLLRTKDTFLFTVEDNRFPGKFATATFSLNQGIDGESLPGFAYMGAVTAAPELRGAGGQVMTIAKSWLQLNGIQGTVYYTNNLVGNALLYAKQGAQIHFETFANGQKPNRLVMFENFTPKPFNQPGATSITINDPNISNEGFYSLAKPFLESGKTIRLELDAAGKPARLWIYNSAAEAGLGPTSLPAANAANPPSTQNTATIESVREGAIKFLKLKAETKSLSDTEKEALLGLIFKRAQDNPSNVESTKAFLNYLIRLSKNTAEWTALIDTARAEIVRSTLSPELRFIFESNQVKLERLNADRFREVLADTGANGPNSSMLSLAIWVKAQHPSWLTNSDGTSSLLGKEIAHIIEGGAKAEIPKTLRTLADDRKWIRFNRNEIPRGMSPGLTTALQGLNAPQRVLEIGAGNGYTSQEILNTYPRAKVTAIDGDAAALDGLSARVGSKKSRLTTVVGDVRSINFPTKQDLIIAERLFAHLNDAEVGAVLTKAAASLNTNGVLVADFYTTAHGSAKSRGANYRSIEDIRNLVARDFVIVSEKDFGGLVTFVLKRKQSATGVPNSQASERTYLEAKNRLLKDPAVNDALTRELNRIFDTALANGKPLTLQTIATLLEIVQQGSKNKWSFFAVRQALNAASANRSLSAQQAVDVAKANEYLKLELTRRFPNDSTGLAELWYSKRFFGVLNIKDAKSIVNAMAQVVGMLNQSYPSSQTSQTSQNQTNLANNLAREGIWQSVRDVLAGEQSMAVKVENLAAAGNFQSKALAHFRKSAFASEMGNVPTSFVHGGHATSGLFAGISGNSVAELVSNVNARVDTLVAAGRLTHIAGGKLGGGASNRVFQDTKTGEIVRVGDVSSTELAETIGLPKISAQLGATVLPEQSLYIPMANKPGFSSTYGISVLVMANAGQPMENVFGSLPPAKKAVALDSFFDALVQLHMSGRYHTDLHLKNVLIDPATGRAVIIDFGRIERTNFAAVNSRQPDGSINPTRANLVNEKDNYLLSQALGKYGLSDKDFRQRYKQGLDRLTPPNGQAALSAFEARKGALRRSMDHQDWLIR